MEIKIDLDYLPNLYQLTYSYASTLPLQPKIHQNEIPTVSNGLCFRFFSAAFFRLVV